MVHSTKKPTPTAITSIIDEATRLLVDAAHPEKIILFGSYARSDFSHDSDLDFLVILPTVKDRFEEMARLRLALRELPIAIDLLVYSEQDAQKRGHLRGTALYHALQEGRILYDAA